MYSLHEYCIRILLTGNEIVFALFALEFLDCSL